MFLVTGSTLPWISVTYPKHPVLYKSQKATDDNIQQKAHQALEKTIPTITGQIHRQPKCTC